MSREKVITTIKEQVKLDAWQREMEERQSSGLSVKAWCRSCFGTATRRERRAHHTNTTGSGFPYQKK